MYEKFTDRAWVSGSQTSSITPNQVRMLRWREPTTDGDNPLLPIMAIGLSIELDALKKRVAMLEAQLMPLDEPTIVEDK